jgi:hypothetical protein
MANCEGMTESEWLRCTDLEPMLELLRGKVSERKLRLFSVACCRNIWHLLSNALDRKAVELAEQFADGLVSREELARATAYGAITYDWPDRNWAGRAARATAKPTALAREVAECAAWARALDGPSWEQLVRVAEVGASEHAPLLKEISGNPFRPMPPRPEEVAPLAIDIYAGKWELMPKLGEWLLEHGYREAGEHCLDRNIQHVKGCWVVDWILGKE